jgi:S1-C subfamily serine protease
VASFRVGTATAERQTLRSADFKQLVANYVGRWHAVQLRCSNFMSCTLEERVAISRIGVSVRDGWTELIDGHEVDGVEVIDTAAESPSARMQSCRMAARAALAQGGGLVATILTPVIALLRAFDRNFMFDDSDVIFAVDGERIRNILDLADRVQSLARGDRIYLTIARRGRRVQICITASP